MKFTNRKQELARLDALYHLPEGGLAVLWGRRRIGKTRLLLEWANKYKGVYYTADESASVVQRKYFAIALESALPGFAAVDYPDWSTLLTRLAKEAIQMGWKGPLIIDELPYLITMSPEFPSLLQRFIDREAKEAKLVVALCGSSQRMMQGAVLDASAPLFGRARETIKLSPITIGYLGEALELDEPRDILEFYSIWGGIPRYWELVKKGATLYENIDQLVLDPIGPLNDEPNRLLLEEIPPAISLRPILDAIGLGAQRLSEIATRIGSPASSLGRPIQRLLELELIERELPFGAEEHNSKRVLYKIKDPFIRFWFDIVASRRSYFAQTRSTHRQKWLKQNLFPLFSKTWEEICRQAAPTLTQKLLGINFNASSRYWHGQGPEWDMLAKSLDEKDLLVGEVKWTEKNQTASWVYKTIESMKSKGFPPVPRSPKAKLHYALFLPEKPKGLTLPKDVILIDAKEVILSLT